jgi:hypothetical protein
MTMANCLPEATGVQRRGRERQRGRDKISHEREQQKKFGDPSIHVQPVEAYQPTDAESNEGETNT